MQEANSAVNLKENQAVECRGPQASSWGPAWLSPKPQVPLRKGRALASGAWAERRTSEQVWQPRSPKLCGPQASGEPGRYRASRSDGPPGLPAFQPLLWIRTRSGAPSSSPSYFHCLSPILSLGSFSPVSLPFFTKAGSEDLGEATACGVANGLFLGSFPPGREQQPLQSLGVGITTRQEPAEAAPCHGASENSALPVCPGPGGHSPGSSATTGTVGAWRLLHLLLCKVEPTASGLWAALRTPGAGGCKSACACSEPFA